MKKLIISLFLLLEVLMVASCKEKTTTNTSTTETDSVTETSEVTSTLLTPLFNGVSEVDATENETCIISLNEVTDGYIKENLNPYKSSSICIDAYFTDESGNTYYRPGYWTQDYKLWLNTMSTTDSYKYDDELKGTDSATKQGIEHFNVSFKPLSGGTFTYRFEVYVNNQYVEKITGSFEVKGSSEEYKGKIVVNNTNERYFMYENTSETYIPVGMNTGWYTSKSRKSYDYDEWFKRMTENNCNWGRIWMASWSFGLHCGTGAQVDDFTNRLNQAARLERVLEVAEEEGVYIYLCMINHGQFSTTVNSDWDNNAYNTIISQPYMFFNNAECKALYKDEIRYIVARYGTYDSIMAYELFNEVDWTDGSSIYAAKIKEWHDEMAKYIDSIDCYKRLITTSYKGTTGSAMSLDSIDIANIHTYDFTNKNAFSGCKELLDKNYNTYKKIVMMAEWGVNASSGYDTYKVDPEGITFYQGLWATLLEGGAGTAMNWWWDEYVHRYNMYGLFKGVGMFASMMDMNGSLTYLDSSNVSVSDGLSFIGTKVDDRVYGYLYDSSYSRINTTVNTFNSVFSIALDDGFYTVTLMNPRTGDIISEKEVSVSDGTLSFMTESFETDLAVIINKK